MAITGDTLEAAGELRLDCLLLGSKSRSMVRGVSYSQTFNPPEVRVVVLISSTDS